MHVIDNISNEKVSAGDNALPLYFNGTDPLKYSLVNIDTVKIFWMQGVLVTQFGLLCLVK